LPDPLPPPLAEVENGILPATDLDEIALVNG
jgi:hypothetical protein